MDGSGSVARWQCHGLEHIAALFWLPLIGRSDADVRNCACPSVKCVEVSNVHSGEERGGGGVQWRGNENVPMLKLMLHAKITSWTNRSRCIVFDTIILDIYRL